MINKVLSTEHDNPTRKMKKFARSPNQYLDYDTDEVSAFDEYKDYVFVFKDMLEIRKKRNFSLFTCGKHENIDV